MRDHDPVVIDDFNGLWRRGDAYSTPADHFSDCNNIQFGEGSFQTRDGLNVYPITSGVGVPNVIKVYNYPKVASESLLLLDTTGNIYDTGSPTPLTPILTIAGMLDFGLVIFAGYAYISPSTLVHGMAGEFLYVYLGAGAPARKAAGQPPKDADGVMTAANSATVGNVEAGIHIFGVVYETDTGFDTQIGPDTLASVNATGGFSVDLASIPVSPNSYVVNKRIVSTRAIDPALFTGDTRGYQFFFVPGAIITNATTTLTVSFYDVELLLDASHLLDLFSEIPAGVGLTQYRGRLVLWTLEPNADQSVIYVSYPGEPEAIDQVSGILSLAVDNYPITICRELRDVLYIFKNLKTFAVSDNGDVPSTWQIITLDQGLGASVHGIAIVVNTGGTSIDYLIVTNYSGVFLFNGTFAFPELSYKIADYWGAFDFGDYLYLEIYCDSIKRRLYIIQPDQQVLIMADYQHGLDPKSIRWALWTFDVKITSITMTNFNQLIIASTEALP